MQTEQNKMGAQPIPGLLLKMGLPMILSMIVQAFYNIVDSYFVSNMTSEAVPNLGDLAINALTLSFPIQMLMIAIGVGTGVGVGSLLSKSLGEGDRDKASRVAGNAIFLGACTFAAFFVFGLLGVRLFLRTQTADAAVLDLGCSYLRICTLASFGGVGGMIYEKLLQGTGKTVLSTVAQLAGAVANIVLDPLLIYGWFGLPALGVAGAAIATVLGQILTLALSMVFHGLWNREIDPSPRYLRPDRETVCGIYRVGAPAILMQALMSVMSYGVNIIFGLVRAAAVTAFGIYYKVQQFVFFAAFGMNNALIPVVAFNYGMGNRARVRQGVRWGLAYTVLLMALGAVALQALAEPVCAAFSLSPDAAALCLRALRVVTLGYVFAGANIAFQGVFQALGFGIRSLAVSLVRLIVVTLPLAWLLTLLPDAANQIWLAFPIAEACGLAAALALHRRVRKLYLG